MHGPLNVKVTHCYFYPAACLWTVFMLRSLFFQYHYFFATLRRYGSRNCLFSKAFRSSEVHCASYSRCSGTGRFVSQGKLAWAWSWPQTLSSPEFKIEWNYGSTPPYALLLFAGSIVFPKYLRESHALQIVACYKPVRLLTLLSAPYFSEVFKHHTCLDRKISASERNGS
jgi:hypothetical protein